MEVVYYPSLVPNNRYTITQLAILFDKVLLPGTYLPLEKLDTKEIEERISGIERVDAERNESSNELLMPLYFAREFKDLSDVFVGTGEWGHMGILEEGASELTRKLEEAYFGPPKPGFIPTPSMGFNIGVGQGDGTKQINGPAIFSYPANAYIFAQRNNLPLISDCNFMPFPNYNRQPVNADILTTQLSVAALGLILPKIKPLSALEILEIRKKMNTDIHALHVTLAAYAGTLRGLLGQGASSEDLRREAEFIAKTEIYPQLEHLKRTLETPGQIVKRNILDWTMENPEIIAMLMLQPQNIQLWMQALNATGKKLKKTVQEIREESQLQNASGLGLLLKIPNKYRR